jgi:hypothetical protein
LNVGTARGDDLAEIGLVKHAVSEVILEVFVRRSPIERNTYPIFRRITIHWPDGNRKAANFGFPFGMAVIVFCYTQKLGIGGSDVVGLIEDAVGLRL